MMEAACISGTHAGMSGMNKALYKKRAGLHEEYQHDPMFQYLFY
jgi:hypothetical protein